MNLESQVCNLELAKKLKELGVKQESLFYYQNNPYNNGSDCMDIMIKEHRSKNNENTIINTECENENNEKFSTFTVADLGYLLPKSIFLKTEDEEKKIFSNFRLVAGRNIIIEEEKPIEVWTVNYVCDTTSEYRNWLFDPLLTKSIYDHNEANARAKMLIYLIENNLVDLE